MFSPRSMLLALLAPIILAAAPTPENSPTPAPGFYLFADAYTNLIDTSAGGPGLYPPEAPGFIDGSPLSPNTPYDLWSSAPLTPGIANIAQANITGKYIGTAYDASATIGLGLVTGSMQNAIYWGENLMPTLNPHLGYTALPYTIAFPTHAGQDDASTSAITPLFASFGAHDGTWLLRGGFFDLQQTDTFVFEQPQLPNVTPNIGLQTPESLGNGPARLDSWPSPEPGLPLRGVDFVEHRGIASLELTSAALPAFPGDTAQASIGSLVFDHGEGTRYSFSYLHVVTGGTSILTTTLFGADPNAMPSPQGDLPSSTLGGQIETIAGARAAFHLTSGVDSVVEIGRTWYDAAGVVEPETNLPGGFYHLGFSRKHGRLTLGIDGYRFEARYANVILPYGTPENVWSAAWAWPGVWLKSTYQLVDNMQAPGANRQGYRVHFALDHGAIEIHAAFSTFHQIAPATFANMEQVGFVDGFFLPEENVDATIGVEHQYNAWMAWHPHFGDITLDYANDEMHRDAAQAAPLDAVGYQTPQTVLTYTHTFNSFAVADIGFGRYAMKGTWENTYTNVDYFQNTVFVGAQLATSPHLSTLVQIRHAQFAGIPSILDGPPPDFGAMTIIFEERIHL